MLNELRADPRIRRRFQFWMFLYPTGLPIPRSAAYLREQLALVRKHVDPLGRHDTQRRMVVIGHSMGGLISKAIVQASGDRLWNSLHPDSFADINASDEVRNHLRNVFFYEPDPHVARVIFIAAPHGGSPVASSSWDASATP